MIELLKEQLEEYSSKLKIVEKEIIRKYKAGEDYSKEVAEANGLKILQQEVVKMMANFV